MNFRIIPRRFCGTVTIPASKSHTIRQLFIASLADGVSEIINPLDSLDTRSCISVCRAFGAEIKKHSNRWEIRGNSGFKKGSIRPSTQIDVGNSGTTLFFALAAAGLQHEAVEFTGDEQIQKRSAAPLLEALAGLGIQCNSHCGFVPITVKGPWTGGKISLPCPTSQYLSALLIASPLAPCSTVTEIEVPLLNEKPYIDMTLSYFKAHNIPFEASADYSRFMIPGGSFWKTFSGSVPGDFSSAAFPAAAAAITGGHVTLLGLDPNDSQGDKFFLEILGEMGCDVQWHENKNDKRDLSTTLTISRKGSLKKGTFDLNAAPDLLPAAAAVAAFAEGDTALVNVSHARIKETDRIAVMARELSKLGVNCTQRPDGLVIHGKGSLSPSEKISVLDGSGDHRIVMALAAAALGGQSCAEITNSECVNITYPEFFDIFSDNEK